MRQDQLRAAGRSRHHTVRHDVRAEGHRGASAAGRPLRSGNARQTDAGPADIELLDEGGGGRVPAGERMGARLLGDGGDGNEGIATRFSPRGVCVAVARRGVCFGVRLRR